MTRMINQINKPSGHTHSPRVRIAMMGLYITSGAFLALAQESPKPKFTSAMQASQSLLEAVQSNNEQAIANILGAPTELTSSRDPGQDKLEREVFVQKYREMHRLSREADGSMILYVGAENWPFPIPLVSQNGAWQFDSAAGQREVMFRRIGENELMATANCREFAAAEGHTHADSADPGIDPLKSLVASAASGSASGDTTLLHGYYYRLVPVQSAKSKHPGSVALIAYPAEYGSSGVMTFAVTKNGVVHERDFGANTPAIAAGMAAFHKDATWHAADR